MSKQLISDPLEVIAMLSSYLFLLYRNIFTDNGISITEYQSMKHQTIFHLGVYMTK